MNSLRPAGAVLPLTALIVSLTITAAPSVGAVGRPRHPSPIGSHPPVTDPVWPRQYYDLHNDSYNSRETIISASNVASLRTVWRSRLPNGATANAGPIVADGRVYIGTPDALYAYDAASGAASWSFFL